MGISDFQKKKYDYVFGKFYDLNNDQVIDWADFEVDLKKLSELLGWKEGSEARQKAVDTLKSVWGGLLKQADKNEDGQISKDEWFKMWDGCVTEYHKNKKMPEWVSKYMQFMFAVNDGNGDDVIDLDEYTAVFTQYGLSADQCKEAFNTITNNGSIKLTMEEYNTLWTEFFTSTEPAGRGNSIFGKIG